MAKKSKKIEETSKFANAWAVHCLHDALLPLARVKALAHPRNRNEHPPEQIEALAKVLGYQGWRYAIKISKLSGKITSGHGRVLTAEFAKQAMVPVVYQDYDDEIQEYADVQADNAIALWAKLDLSGINQDLGELGPFDLDILGIKNFTVDVADKGGLTDEDHVPSAPAIARTKPGDLYQLGDHRLVCGDSTSIDVIDKLMGGKRADICFTSPPYNVGKTPNGNDQKYLNSSDDKSGDEFCDFLCSFTNAVLTVCDFAFVNIQSLSGNKVALIDYLHAMKVQYADTIIWDKLTAEPAMAKNVLNSRFEYIHVFSHRANRVIGKKEFRGTLENVFQFNSRKDKDFASIHKATFPVAFAEHFLVNFAKDSVIEPFGGSGTTMIAAEKHGLSSFLVELDPIYCDVIVSRWEAFTGRKAELIRTE